MAILRILFLSLMLAVALSGCFEDPVGKSYNLAYNPLVASAWNTTQAAVPRVVGYRLQANKIQYTAGDPFVATYQYQNLTNVSQTFNTYLGFILPDMNTVAFATKFRGLQLGTVGNPASWSYYDLITLAPGQILSGTFSTIVPAGVTGEVNLIGAATKPRAFADRIWNQGDVFALAAVDVQVVF